MDKCNGRHSAADKIFAPGHLMGAAQYCGRECVKMLWNHCGPLLKPIRYRNGGVVHRFDSEGGEEGGKGDKISARKNVVSNVSDWIEEP